jgi:hypothetical protein
VRSALQFLKRQARINSGPFIEILRNVAAEQYLP